MSERPINPGADLSSASRGRATASQMALLLDELAYGCLLISFNGSLLEANLVGKDELAKRVPLRLEDGFVRAYFRRDAALLHQSLRAAEAGRKTLLTLGAGNEPSLSIAVIPSCADGEGWAALVLSRASVCDPLMLCLFARNHHITGTEEKVLALLSQGRSAPEIAAEMGVAVSTIRTHIQSACAKANRKGIRNLLAQLATLPPLRAATIRRAVQ